MEIEWQFHARQRLLERHISESLVRKTVREPQQTIGEGTHRVFQRRFFDATRKKEHLIRVVVDVHHHVVIIRTVYRTSKIHKYWRLE